MTGQGFYTVARYGKPPSNIVLPPSEHNGKIDRLRFALSECRSSYDCELKLIVTLSTAVVAAAGTS